MLELTSIRLGIRAERHGASCDMVVIPTHGISGWHPFICGSAAEKVVKLVQCPLLLLRSVKAPS
ncbi:MAG: universal stress protein [Acidobacteriaceae bacterium]